MSLATDEKLQRIEAAIESEELAPVPSILVGYLLLTEWAGSDGDTYLVESRPEPQTYWRSLGLIEAARMSIDHGVQAANQSHDDDEDDE